MQNGAKEDLAPDKRSFPLPIIRWGQPERLRLSARHLASACEEFDDIASDWRVAASDLIANSLLTRATGCKADQVVSLFGDDSRIGLRASELTCLLVARQYGEKNEPIGYAEVIDFTLDFTAKPLAEGTLHKSFVSLVEYGLLKAEPAVRLTSAGRPRQLYSITRNGYVALYLAIATALHLAESRTQAAA